MGIWILIGNHELFKRMILHLQPMMESKVKRCTRLSSGIFFLITLITYLFQARVGAGAQLRTTAGTSFTKAVWPHD